MAVCRAAVEDRRGDEGAEEADRADEGRERLACPPRDEHCDEEHKPGDAEQHELGREREPVDVRLHDHGTRSIGA